MNRTVQTYRQKKSKNRSGFYFLLSIVMVVALIKWGIPGFLNFLAGPSKKGTVNTTTDTLPPQVPVLSAIPEATNSANISVDGYTEKGVKVSILDNGNNVGEVTTGDDGSFSIPIKLVDGNNEIQAKAADVAGNESQSQSKTVVLDTKAPEIKIVTPANGAEFFGSANQQVEVKGAVDDAHTEVTLNNSFVRVAGDGSFDQKFKMSDGDNKITLVATDTAGNQSTQEISVKFSL